MSQEDLIPINSTERAKELGSKGGKVKSPAKKYAALQTASKNALCKNCKAMCMLRDNNLTINKHFKCSVPEARAFAIWYDSPVMDKGVLKKLSHQTLLKIYNNSKDNKDLKMVHNALMEQLKTEFPEIQKSINLHGIQGEVTVRIEREDIEEGDEKK